VLLAALLPLLAHAGEAAIRRTLAERYPMLTINAVSLSPIPGLYEVWAGGKLFYADENGDYILGGPLVDTRSKRKPTGPDRPEPTPDDAP
jgi:thiol:disulfide interchange protein DsbC